MINSMLIKTAVTAFLLLSVAANAADGEIRKVDKDAKKITIKHGPISSINMPPMTMVFQVKDPAMLDQVKTGDKVRFEAEKAGSAYVVTKIESAN
jgi:Cu(I)/Ag(I) efflux system protein CusF